MHASQVKPKQSPAAEALSGPLHRASRDGASASRQSPWATSMGDGPPAGLFSLADGIQARLEISRPGDPYEQEADHVAEQVMRMSDQAASPRRCACGGVAGPDGECAACQAKRLAVQRREASQAAPPAAPPIVHKALRGPGRPLDAATRAFMEPRFGQDFSGVRVHTNSEAAESAQAVSALAYTVGQNIVFGGGQFAPGTAAGQRLLAHELAHVVQQRGMATRLQREISCPARPTGESAQSRNPGGILPVDVVFSAADHQLDIMDFAVNSDALPAGVTSSPDWQRAISFMIGDPSTQIAVTGFTDCVGSNAENRNLRAQRVQAVINAMPPVLQRRVVFRFTTSTTDFLAPNDTPENRARNRSVRVTFSPLPQSSDPCDRLRRAANLDEYLFLVRCVEQRLGLTAPGDARTTLSLLRQIYYGSASWSISRTSIWDMVITDRPWTPGTDPTTRLGPSLMAALRASQEVERTDVGHVFTGIDAMLNPHEVELRMGRFSLATGLANEEWATWAGDVGSAAAESAVDTYAGTSHGNFDFYFTSYASDDDLFGDIDSFAIRAGFNPTSTPSAQLRQAIRLRGPLSEALLQYYRLSGTPVGQARGNRVESFIQAYGGIITGGMLTNPSALITALRPSVENFAGRFVLRLMLERGLLNNPPSQPAGAPTISTLLATAVDEMTSRFVTWLTTHR